MRRDKGQQTTWRRRHPFDQQWLSGGSGNIRFCWFCILLSFNVLIFFACEICISLVIRKAVFIWKADVRARVNIYIPLGESRSCVPSGKPEVN